MMRPNRAEPRLMASSRIVPVIMCGGAGTRLWPVSRESMPKQFVPLVGPDSTFQQVLARIADPELFDTADRHHQHRLPLRGRRAVARARHRGRHRARTDAARLRAGGRGRGDARGASAIRTPSCWCSRPIMSSASPTSFAPPAGRRPRAAAEGQIVTFGIAADPSGDQLRLHPSGRAAQRHRGARGRGLRRKARRGDRRRLRGGPLSLEQRQFPVSRRDHAGRDRAFRAGDGGGCQGRRSRDSRAISISCGSPPSRSRARRRSRSTMR